MKRKLVFRKWLDSFEILPAYVRAVISRDAEHVRRYGDWPRDPMSPAKPGVWLIEAFPWDWTPEGGRFWGRANDAWMESIRFAKLYRIEIEAGMPIDDKLGLTLVLAELEE